MALLEAVRHHIQDPRCLVKGKLAQSGCAVKMDDTPNQKLVIDLDKPGAPLKKTQTRCDYLVVAEEANGTGWVVVLELKKGKLHASRVIAQLQAGADAAEELVPQEEAVRFRPALFSGDKSRHELARLRTKIRFHGHSEPTRLRSCGQSLKEVLR